MLDIYSVNSKLLDFLVDLVVKIILFRVISMGLHLVYMVLEQNALIHFVNFSKKLLLVCVLIFHPLLASFFHLLGFHQIHYVFVEATVLLTLFFQAF